MSDEHLADGLTDYLEGKVKVDEYVTHHRTLAEINAGFHDMHVSTAVRRIVRTICSRQICRPATASAASSTCLERLSAFMDSVRVSRGRATVDEVNPRCIKRISRTSIVSHTSSQ